MILGVMLREYNDCESFIKGGIEWWTYIKWFDTYPVIYVKQKKS